MAGETDFSLLNWMWGVLSLPIIWLYTRNTNLEAKMDAKVSKEEMREYVDLRLNTIEYKLDMILAELKNKE